MNDLRFAFRQLRKSPGFTGVAVLTLALGIGANTAIFSVINAVILRPLPYYQPDHLVRVWGNFAGIGLPNNQNAISAPELKDLESQSRCFSHVAAIASGESFNLKRGDYPQRFEGAYVTPALFPLLGVPPALGRAFLPTETEAGQGQVVILSHSLWNRSFGADPGVVGQQLNINGLSHEVVGVMPAGFRLFGAELWAPLVLSPDDLKNRSNHGLLVLARVKPELSLEQARADLRRLTEAVKEQNPDYPYARFEFAFMLTPWLEEMVGGVQTPLWILAGAVALVLLIACANVANLLLVRAAAREREVAVRMALGASRGRLFCQWVIESLMLSVLGGLAGLFLAQAGLQLLIQVSTTVFPRVTDAVLDAWVLAFTTLVSLGTGVLFGLAPGLHAARGVEARTLRGADRTVTAGVVFQRVRHALIVIEVALSLVLLSAAGLLVRSLAHVLAVEGGFRPENVLTMRVSLPERNYEEPHQVRAFYREVLDRVARLPGVEAGGATSFLPLSGEGLSGTITVDSRAVAPDLASPEADQCLVTPAYFQAMGIPVLSGRAFEARDADPSQPVAIIDETLAKVFWPKESAIGKCLRRPGENAPWATIIGVVRHVRNRTLEAPSRIQVYWPADQTAERSLTLAIRTKVPPRSLATSVQREIAAVDPEQPAYSIKTMEEWMEDSLALRRLGTLLLSVFSGVALALAAVGIYGVVGFSVSQRTREIGLRVALGARKTDVLGLILKQGLLLAGIGGALGMLGAAATTRLLGSLLYQVQPTDPASFALGALVMGTVALLACYFPARRAAKVDPVVALRSD